jgi:hypothetical protein
MTTKEQVRELVIVIGYMRASLDRISGRTAAEAEKLMEVNAVAVRVLGNYAPLVADASAVDLFEEMRRVPETLGVTLEECRRLAGADAP